MFKKIILLTKSRKHGGYCTAGIDCTTGKWIRFISDDRECRTDEVTEKHMTYNNGQVAEVLDVIQIGCKEFNPYYYQPENYLIDINNQWLKLGTASINKILRIHPFETKEYLFFDTYYKISDTLVKSLDEEDIYSLIFISVKNPIINVNVKPWNGEKSVTMSFKYNSKNYRFFRITDEIFESEYYQYDYGNYTLFGNYGLVISLGESFAWESNHSEQWHYKLIAKVFEL
jgi:hypothetical protein